LTIVSADHFADGGCTGGDLFDVGNEIPVQRIISKRTYIKKLLQDSCGTSETAKTYTVSLRHSLFPDAGQKSRTGGFGAVSRQFM